ncbi:NADPH:quinone reductase [Desulfomonile tiedjei]|uniref:Zn-dependent oxidoreductase, NADPH:quinone reductase n=1 Tax=Desulfomonile tiedjei (strain ATCC 49306 / DSM 6799 / DCB-1) TaxID=706587 RepID=I4C7Z7_DESTA|nr:NADPH:quinone reductase [Desulfomonile tiedjei]AFM25688.1 Zn-dependent oxidoreductase, NADPH:quinone reductase [Desulfomonile tiedjei DSM 6799]
MKAIRVHEFGGPEVMRLEEVTDLTPGPDQLLIRIKAVGVNPVDTYVRSGQYANLSPLPYTPGTDAAGIIESIGKEVPRFAVGDRVYVAGTVTGAYAEQALCLKSQVHMLPEGVSYSQGAAIGIPYGIAYRALFNRAVAKPGEIVLVHGATGGVGLAALQLARNAGMIVIGTGGSDEGRQLVLQHGAHHVIDHHAADHFKHIMDITEGRGVDVILEMLANVNLGNDLKVLSRGGRVVVIGSRGTVEIDPRDAMSRDAAILGVLIFNASDQELTSIHAALGAGLRNNTIRPFIGAEIPLAEAPRAHEKVMESRTYGKVVLVT